MGGTAFAVVQAGSANNPARPRGRAVISAVQSTGSTSANVTFVFPNVAPCNGDSRVTPGVGIISYTAIANTGQTATISSTSPNKIDINGLAANTVYKFQVFATNGIGNSDSSGCSAAITIQTIAEAPVIGAITVTCTTASMPITMPTFTGGNTITSTTVNISPGGTPFTNPGSAPFTAPFTGLTQNTPYTFTAFVTTPIGTGRSRSLGATTKGPVTINYMLVAGGGGGGRSQLNTPGPGNAAGGGGGGGGVTKGSFARAPGTVIPFTVGGGGGGGPPTVGNGTPGSPTSMACATTALGGGGGAGFAIGPTGNPLGGASGLPGGNGGGGAVRVRTATSPAPPTLLGMQPSSGGPGSQGFNGGSSGGAPGGPPFPALPQGGGGGGGGGAGGTGGCGFTGPQASAPGFPGRPGAGGVGGAGTTWPFTMIAPTITYGAGGGGAQVGPSPSVGPALPGGFPVSGSFFGGGGRGGGPVNSSTAGVSGNTGGVFIAVLTSQYPGTAPGATVSTPPAAPGYTVLQWTSPGSYTV